jgi:general secretion pathway protein N
LKRWWASGLLLGAAVALAVFAPAAWLAQGLAQATGGRLLLADARGTVWAGSAVMVLTAGQGSRDSSALPGRMNWTLGLSGMALALRAQHACCIQGELKLRIVPGLARLRVELLPPPAGGSAVLGQWPASWLVGLGTPWNTLQPTGNLLLSSPGFAAEVVQGRWVLTGRAELQIRSLASSLSTLDELGHYQLTLQGDERGDAAQIQLGTSSGALQLTGSGQWAASRLRFNGQASAAPGSEAALNNLLNLIGRRQGALSLISIG